MVARLRNKQNYFGNLHWFAIAAPPTIMDIRRKTNLEKKKMVRNSTLEEHLNGLMSKIQYES